MQNQKNFDLMENMLSPLKAINNEPHSESTGDNYKYEKPIEYWLLVIGYAIGYGSFWRFSYLIYSCG
jgi:hypothetical protein